MSELISREEAIRAIQDIVAVGTFVEGMKEKCLRAIKDVPVIDSDPTMGNFVTKAISTGDKYWKCPHIEFDVGTGGEEG